MFPTKLRLSTYCGIALNIFGLIEVEVQFEQKKQRLPLYVVDVDRHALLSRGWIGELGIDLNKYMNSNVNSVNFTVDNLESRIRSLIEKYSSV